MKLEHRTLAINAFFNIVGAVIWGGIVWMFIRYIIANDPHPIEFAFDLFGIKQNDFVRFGYLSFFDNAFMLFANVFSALGIYSVFGTLGNFLLDDLKGITTHRGYKAYRKHQADERAILEAEREKKRAQSVSIRVMFEESFGDDEVIAGKWGWETTYQDQRSTGMEDTEIEALAEAVRVAYSSVGLRSHFMFSQSEALVGKI